MALARTGFVLHGANNLFRHSGKCGKEIKILENVIPRRNAVNSRSGAILPEPKTTPFGIVGVVCGVVIGLFIGAAISKNVANFLEENDLFVPSDDDDDDD